MHKYITVRATPRLMRRFIEDLERKYYSYFNRKTGKKIGMLQLTCREVKVYELTFPATAKINIKKDVLKVMDKHQEGEGGGIAIHWGPWKKDKYYDDGSEKV